MVEVGIGPLAGKMAIFFTNRHLKNRSSKASPSKFDLLSEL